MSAEKVKLKIDEEDLLENAMVYYKVEEFDPTKRLTIVYSGQSPADTEGVVRQFYTLLLCAVSKQQFFQGLDYRTPIYSSDVAAAGVMKLVGVMVVHSILQGGTGFPIFSPAVYNYLCKGALQEAVKTMITDDCSLHMQDLITKVRKGKFKGQLEILAKTSPFLKKPLKALHFKFWCLFLDFAFIVMCRQKGQYKINRKHFLCSLLSCVFLKHCYILLKFNVLAKKWFDHDPHLPKRR